MPTPFAIGPHRFETNLILAPMAGISDRPFRALCRRLGAGTTVAEMVSASTALWATPKSARRLDYRGESGPVWAQIVGADPLAMARAARASVDLGADIIDINMGCPAKKVCKQAAGAALLRDESLVGRILAAVVAAVTVPVTLKIRTGWSPQTRNAARIAALAYDAGIAALTVHGRTRSCGYAVPAEYETLREIRSSIPIPLIANGDITTPARAKAVLHATGADAIMIGRAARGRPWIFRDIAAFLDTGILPAEPPPDWILALLREHLESIYHFYGASAGVRIARKHIAWYSHHLPGAASFRDTINRIETPAEQLARVAAFFERRLEMETRAA
ncbi:MAG: tRNA dihydrouridine synthase DusB [Sphingobacteriia bacterium]|nr:tRNA dihydrouridine synthase DusB [Sphingobacteriia bacterium]NCC38023.1 tRNA dihydrouridine synthase DusB [Gammaproteobacteria bacterium]